MAKKPKATHQGEVNISDIKIRCYNLDTGERVLSREGLLRALGKTGNPKYKEDLFQTPVFLRANNLQPFITNDLIASSQPIEFMWGESKVYGYKADILPHVCYVFIDAEKAGILTDVRQKRIAERCEILIRGFATTGIIALVDEATGYERERERGTLQKFLEQFLEKEHGKWVRTFPDEFFETIYKMKGWNWRLATKGQKPGVMGKYINDFVWSRLAPNVLKELREKNPVTEKGYRKYKHPQFINPDFGHPILKDHLKAIITLGKAAGYNWTNFKRLINRAYPKCGEQIEMDYPDDN